MVTVTVIVAVLFLVIVSTFLCTYNQILVAIVVVIAPNVVVVLIVSICFTSNVLLVFLPLFVTLLRLIGGK